MKTRQEVEDLKKQWMIDPIWDLEQTEGFEDYKIELEIFSLKQKLVWARNELAEYHTFFRLAREIFK